MSISASEILSPVCLPLQRSARQATPQSEAVSTPHASPIPMEEDGAARGGWTEAVEKQVRACLLCCRVCVLGLNFLCTF